MAGFGKGMTFSTEVSMRVSWQRLLTWVPTALPTVGILVLLALLGWYGSATDWKAPSLKALRNANRLSDLFKMDDKTAEEGKEEKKEPSPDEKEPPPPVEIPKEAANQAGVRTTPARRQVMGEYVTAHGEIDFNQYLYAHLTTRAAGIVRFVEKQPGDRIKKGDLLALIASTELARLKNDFQQSMYQVEQRQLMLERRQRAATALAGEQILDATMALRDAKIRMLNDQQSLENLGLHVRSRDLMKLEQEEISERLRLLDIPEEIIRHEGKERIASNLLPMRAPFDGEVMHRDMVLGEMVTPGPPQFIIADLSKLWLRLYLHQQDQEKVKLGQKVFFQPRGSKEKVPVGVVFRVSAEVDAKSRLVPVFAEVDNRDGRLRPNTFGDGDIRVNEHSAVVVPNGAIQWDTQGRTSVVFVKVSENVYEPRRVNLGAKTDKVTEILAGDDPKDPGVKEGEEVVAEGSFVLLSQMNKSLIKGED
jgi:cobalt-zinc-cadmium efflux system membrane fusion protein